MPPNPKAHDSAKISAESTMAGILALMIDERENRTSYEPDAPRTEVLLSRAGMSVDEIVRLTGKKSDTVRKIILRAAKGGNG
jgi:predicted transcriptional regulator